MANLDVQFDNTLPPRRLTAKEIASLVSPNPVPVVVAFDQRRSLGHVTVTAAGAWDERRVDMILDGPDATVAAIRSEDDSARPNVSIGYTVDVPGEKITLREIAVGFPGAPRAAQPLGLTAPEPGAPTLAAVTPPPPAVLGRRRSEIDDAITRAREAEMEGRTEFPGLSYEEGVAHALDWVVGETDEHPLTP